jgi:hypothetical protein
MATITGIVRRAWPTASDQRFSIVPRDPDDVRLGPAPAANGTGGGGTDTGDASGDTRGDATAVADGGTGPGGSDAVGADASGAVVARLADLPRLVGRRVRIGATVATSDGTTITLRDGSATGRVRLTGELPSGEAPLEPGEVVNVTGTVARPEGRGDPEVVAAPADLTRASRLALPSAAAAPLTTVTAEVTVPDGVSPDATGSQAAHPGTPWLALVTVVLAAIVLAIGGAFAWRDRRIRRDRRPEATADEAAEPAGPREGLA